VRKVKGFLLVNTTKMRGKTMIWYIRQPPTMVRTNSPMEEKAVSMLLILARAVAIRLATPIGVVLENKGRVSFDVIETLM
jgi:hypothetical protein